MGRKIGLIIDAFLQFLSYKFAPLYIVMGTKITLPTDEILKILCIKFVHRIFPPLLNEGDIFFADLTHCSNKIQKIFLLLYLYGDEKKGVVEKKFKILSKNDDIKMKLSFFWHKKNKSG